MAFLRPGSKSSHAFGISFDRPKESNERSNDEPRRNGASASEYAAATMARREAELLPVARYKRELLYLVEQHSVVIVLGETGSGKTTQIPQYLHEAGWTARGRCIAVTQPRRAAAATVAARVAEEVGCDLGTLVGFGVRFESLSQPGVTRIKFLTDGVLLREMMDDPLLTQYSVVMVDEAHERSLATDMLLGLLKKVLRVRPDLRVIVSSATLQAPALVAFFGGLAAPGNVPQNVAQTAPGAPPNRAPAVVSIEGRTHPVEVHYLSQPCANYVTAAVTAVMDIHRADEPGDVLVFLTGQQEVEAAVRQLDQEATRLHHSTGYGWKLLPLPLYAGLPGHLQRAALGPAPRGHRKVVVATNIAETSLTLEGVVYVVDCCFVKQRAYNPLLGLEALCVAPTSKASAQQRAGRAGRVRPGKAFRLLTEADYERLLPDASLPEVQRSDLTAMVLQLKALGIDNVMKFEWLSPPPAEAMVRALEGLAALGVLDSDARLTGDIGMRLASLPLDPPLGRALLASFDRAHECSEEVATIVALLSASPHGVWSAHAGKKATEEAMKRFAVAEGDLVTLLNVWRAWHDNDKSSRWCARHCLNPHALHKAVEVRAQVVAGCKRLGLPALESCGGDMDILRRALVTGLFMNAATYERTDHEPLAPESDPGTNVYRLVRPVGGTSGTVLGAGGGSSVSGAVDSARLRLRVHSGSVLARCKPAWVVFVSVAQSDSGWYEMAGVTAIDKEWLLQQAPHYYQQAR